MGNVYPYRFYPPYSFSPFNNRNNPYYYKSNKKSEYSNQDRNHEEKENSDEGKRAKKINNSPYSNNPIFELFGIQLYFDDILLISLIYFLYSEGVQDQFLFIALILLLLT